MTTVSHDSHNITAFGRNPDDMTLAANTLRDIHGGPVVVAEGKGVASLMLPIAGLISERSHGDVAKEFFDLGAALETLVDWQPPYLVFKVLFGASLVCNAGPRLSDVVLLMF